MTLSDRPGKSGAAQRASSWLWPAGWFGKLFIGLIASVLATGVVVPVLAELGLLPAVRDHIQALPVVEQIGDQVQSWRVHPMPARTYNILVADLAGDERGRQTAHLQHSLVDQFDANRSNVRVQRSLRPLRVRLARDTATELEAAHERGRRQLAKLNADVLVWGEIVQAPKDRELLRLSFLPRIGAGSDRARGYELGRQVELPRDFGEDLGAVLAAEIAATMAVAFEGGKFLADILEPMHRRLEALVERMPAAFTDDQRAELRDAYAIGAYRIGEQTGNPAPIEIAVQQWRAIAQHFIASHPLRWARTQNNLGSALWTLGQRDIGSSRAKEAAAAFRAALDQFPRQRFPIEWAWTQSNLGSAMWFVGERETGTRRLEEASAAFSAALEELPRSRNAQLWSWVQNNLGYTLISLSERESGSRLLHEAVTRLRLALDERPRRRVPLDWAMSSNDLGVALVHLGARADASAHLEEAAVLFRSALEEFPRRQVPTLWAMTMHDLGTGLVARGEREGSAIVIEEGIAALRQALEERTRERAPFDWAKTQLTLGKALALLGKQKRQRDLVVEAKGASGRAAEVLKTADADFYLASAERLLREIDGLLTQLDSEPK